MDRIPVTFFVSYAHEDKTLVGPLVESLWQQLGPSKRYLHRLWRDTLLLVGEEWHQEILKALDECDFGLLLVSPAFLGSEYIRNHERPRFTGQAAKPCIPVMLAKVDFDRHDLQGLDVFQFFRLGAARFAQPKSYADCAGARQRRRFVEDLFVQIEARLDKHFAAAG